MTVYELIQELLKYPPLDEVKIAFGELTIEIDGIAHVSTYGQHLVIID